MGMYDTITYKMKCPKCDEKFEFTEQVKWTNACLLYDYRVGDKIDANDGEYDWATLIRPELKVKCPNCNEEIYYKAIVKDGVLTEIRMI